MLEIGRSDPGEFLRQHPLAAVAALIVAQRDGGVEPALVEFLQHVPRGSDPQIHDQTRLRPVEPAQQHRQFGADDIVADPDGQAPLLGNKGVQRMTMGLDQAARRIEEQAALGRQADQPRRPLEQAAAETFLQPFNAQADRRLGRVERLGGAREALEIGDQNEGLDRLEIEGAHDQPFKSVIFETWYHALIK